MELRNFVFSAQDLISGSPNRGRGTRVIVIKTWGITKNVIYLSRFKKHNYDLLYTQSLFPILPHITKVIL